MMVRATFGYHDFKARNEWATDFERRAIRSQRLAGESPLCAHNFVTEAVRRNPLLDNNAVQAEGMAACIAAQLAALAEAEEKK